MKRSGVISSISWLFACCCFYSATAQSTQMSTYCNPINIDYTYSIYNANDNISYRSGADPAVVAIQGGVLYVCYPLHGILAFY